MTLAEAKKQQKNYRALINGERDGSIPLNRDIRLMIAEDERHLDLLQNQRRKIFKSDKKLKPIGDRL